MEQNEMAKMMLWCIAWHLPFVFANGLELRLIQVECIAAIEKPMARVRSINYSLED